MNGQSERAHGSRSHTCVVGLAWGDEGKGKIVDLLSGQFEVVVRYNGGANAGHTVCIGDQKYALHLLPTGVLRDGSVGVIGPGVVIDPVSLVQEIEQIESQGAPASKRLIISDRAHVVMPHHQSEDRHREAAKDDSGKIGTTARGIGPCYADKMQRTTAVRMADLRRFDEKKELIRSLVEQRAGQLERLYGKQESVDAGKVCAQLEAAAKRLSPLICDTTHWLLKRVEEGAGVLYEGANGVLLDVDHGTYPFVTSSNTSAAGVAAGAGVPPQWLDRVVGVTKAYTTRVGGGPFPTELRDATGDQIRERGHEYGTTTGRPRRCGWLDAFALHYAAHLTGVTDVAVTHLDTLTGFERIACCTGYTVDGRPLESFPADADLLERAEPVLEWFEGWSEPISDIRDLEALPEKARKYLNRVSEICNAPVTMVGVGAGREQTILNRQRWSDVVMG